MSLRCSAPDKYRVYARYEVNSISTKSPQVFDQLTRDNMRVHFATRPREEEQGVGRGLDEEGPLRALVLEVCQWLAEMIGIHLQCLVFDQCMTKFPQMRMRMQHLEMAKSID